MTRPLTPRHRRSPHIRRKFTTALGLKPAGSGLALTAAVMAFTLLPSVVRAQPPIHTPEGSVIRTLQGVGSTSPSAVTQVHGNRGYSSLNVQWPDGERGSAVFDRARLRLLSVHRAGRLYYAWQGAEAVAHRASVNHAPENTLQAIETAIRFGAARAEIDLRTTSDGELVLLHDSTVDRTTNGTGEVANLTLAQVAVLDAGSWFGEAFSDQKVPTAQIALRTMKGRIAPDLDLKDARPEAVVDLLAAVGMLPSDDLAESMRPTVFARDLADITRLLELAPGLKLRPSITGSDDRALAELLDAVDAPIVNIDWRNFSPSLVDSIHRRGKLAFVNTLGDQDSRERIELALLAGADFIQSDLTEALVELTTAAATLPWVGRSVLDAHNAYPYHGEFSDRIDRALQQGLPMAVEQDLCFFEEADGGRSIVSHGPPFDGSEPGLEESFFNRAAPLLEEELLNGDPKRWPVLVLNLDLKGQGDHATHHQAIRDILARYEHLLVTAERTAEIDIQAPLRIAPLLVLTGASDEQQSSFHDQIGVGELLFIFGAAKTDDQGKPEKANNYRRWWNNPWSVVEGEPQPLAGSFEPAERDRLSDLVEQAHRSGLWLRFYTLNGHPVEQAKSRGFSASYNFGSLEAAKIRWRAARELGVDFIASDQYEELAETLASSP